MSKKNKKGKKKDKVQAAVNVQEHEISKLNKRTKEMEKAVMGMRQRVSETAGGAKAIALAMSLPGSGAGIRLPTEDGPRTSVMTCRDQFTVTSNQYQWADFNAGDALFLFYGQPGRAVLTWSPIPANCYYICNFVNPNNNFTLTNYTNAWIVSPNPIPTTAAASVFWPFAGAGPSNSSVAPHGTWLPAGLSDDIPFIMMNAGDKLILTVTTLWSGTASGQMNLDVYLWQGPKTAALRVQSVGYTVASGQVSAGTIFTATSFGYYALSFEGFVINSGSVTSSNNGFGVSLLTPASVGGGFVNRTLQDMDNTNFGDAAIGQMCRVNAASLLVTNTSSLLNRQGTVLAARVRLDNPVQLTVATLRRVAERYAGDAANGCYTFKEFSRQSEEFIDVVGTGGALGFDLDYEDYVHVIQMTCPGYATAANTFTVSVDTCIEFKTDVARYQKAVSPFRYTDLVEARKVINSNPIWFYENPLHMSQIYGFVQNMAKKFMQGVNAVAPYAATVAGVLQPDKAVAYQALATALKGLGN